MKAKTATSEFVPQPLRHVTERVRVHPDLDPVSLTHQSHKDACDLTSILKKYDNVGLIPEVDPKSYVDCRQLQGKSRAQLIMESREQVHLAAAALDKEQKDAALARKKQLDADLAELKALREKEKEARKASDS